ncbi:MAG: hypothetical protein IIA01_06835, partial [Proteobacteria bacterium]|nr:hypothetical protein [Pseudomonadota bacterium]
SFSYATGKEVLHEVDMIAALRALDGRFVKYGGHSQAVGFTVKSADLDAVREELSGIAERELGERDRQA